MARSAIWMCVTVGALLADGFASASEPAAKPARPAAEGPAREPRPAAAPVGAAGPTGTAGEGPPARGKSEKASAGPDGGPPTPPSLTTSALRQELGRAEPAASPLSEHQRLESLAADLVRAREALRTETARLEAVLRTASGMRPMASGDPTGGAWAAPRSDGQPVSSGQVEVVSKAFRGMKPEQAAALIGHLERGLAAEVLLRMRPADAGAILGLLRPEVGAALATEIARQPPPPRAKGPPKGAP